MFAPPEIMSMAGALSANASDRLSAIAGNVAPDVYAIRDGGPAPVTAAQALEVMRVLEAGHASAREGRAIAFG